MARSLILKRFLAIFYGLRNLSVFCNQERGVNLRFDGGAIASASRSYTKSTPMTHPIDLWVPLALLGLIIAAAIYFGTISK